VSTPSNPEHVRRLAGGVEQWNAWRESSPTEVPRLRDVDMSRVRLDSIDLRGADLYTATFWRANLNRAHLQGADLSSANLNGASLRGADLRGANLRFARLVGADVADARFSGCHVYGCATWNLHGQPADQLDVVVTPRRQAPVTVDDLLLAQFIYLLMNSGGLRDALQLVASKAVLLLGRFTPERKAVLDSLREELRTRGFIPIMFDFERLPNQTLMQTVSTLAHMSRSGRRAFARATCPIPCESRRYLRESMLAQYAL
jgi:Pentapeptide repeats (8 copies)